MKRFLTPIFSLLLVYGLNAQAQTDTARTKKDTIPSQIRLDTLLHVPNAKPIFNRDTISSTKNGKSSPVLKSGEATGSMMMTTTEDVGKTPVYIDVSPSGAAVANIPITIPPGLHGFTPEVSLAYNSQGGNGVVGYGWGIGGLSSISRIPATKFHNDRIGGINLDMNDLFALDGQRLLLKTGTYGHPNSDYQTENYSNLRVFSRGSVPIGTSTGPDYFEVWYPDGSKAIYGAANSSKTVIEYGISYRESNLGARINYVYTSTSNILKLLQINYGTLGTGLGINVINFSYETAQRSDQAYTAGQNVYRDFILNKISVSANGTPLRHYNVETNAMNLIGYQRLDGLVETNGDETKSLGRIYFSYEISSDVTYSSTVSNLSLYQIASNNSDAVFGDFTGSGTMDFILRPTGKNKFWTFFDLEPNYPYMQFSYEVNTGYYKEVFPVKWLTQNSKMLSGDGFAVVKDQYGSYKFDVLSRGSTSPVYFQYDRLWNAPRAWGYYSECDNQFHDGPVLDQEFISGDFNGDGLTDIIAINRPYYGLVTWERMEEDNPWDPWPLALQQTSSRPPPSIGICVQEYGNMEHSEVHFINLDRRITTNFVTNIGNLNKSYQSGDKLYTGDFNGDGKTDILHVANGIMFVYGLNDTNYLQLLWQENDTRISLNETVLLGDYNGDGKTDVMFSTTTSLQYALFMSKGGGFKKHNQMLPWPFGKGSKNQYYYQGQWHQNSTTLLPIDINGDGKTDFSQVYSETTDNSSTGTIKLRRTRNMGYTEANGITFAFDMNADEDTRQTNIRHNPIPVVLSLDKQNFNLEVGFLSDNTLSLYRLGANMQVAKKLKTVWNKGETHDVAYKPLLSGYSYSNNTPIYETSYGQTYPNVEFENIPNLSVVSKITRAYNNTNHLQQIFGYANGVSNTEGLGFLGFGKIIRSNWHVDAGDNNKTFDMIVADPALRGAVVNSFKMKYPYLNPSILSSSLVSDGATINDYITRSEVSYQTQTLPNKVFINTVASTVSKDLLTGVTSQNTNEYDSYYNITKTTSNVNNLASKVDEATYDNNPLGYYIGRPLTQKSTITVGSDTHSAETETSYTGFLPTQIKKKGHGTPWITDNLTYDAFGNIISKSVTTASGTRTNSATYDATGRFALSQTDTEGLTSSATYDDHYGVMLTSTNAYGYSSSFTYDSWGRLTGSENYLATITSSSYSTDPNGYVFTTTDEDGSEKKTYTNEVGQVTQSTKKTLTGSSVGVATEYDVYGRAFRQSQPAAPGNYNQWNETEFDEYGRVKKTTAYTGKATNISYSGLSTTVNDGTKSTTTTKNALGQNASQQDPGGPINYSYYAHGGLKTADYGGSIQTLEYDGWGRKTKLTDPSAGQYTYAYNGFGEITQETTPKGVTNYTYDNTTGKLISKTLTGDATNLAYTYNYNNLTKQLDGLTFTNADGNNANYGYTYDEYMRLTSTVEDNLHAKFTKIYTYDGFDRIATESYEAKDKASNTTATRTVGYTYQNGELLQSVDQTTGKILSKINTLKSNGQLATELQGSDLKTTYSYDSFNLPQSTVTERIGNPSPLMNLGYSFDALRGNLNSRSNTAFGWSETFTYDNQDRLTDFNDNNGNNSQSYDQRGRITNNSQLGNYVYNGEGYQQTELTSPTPAANTWYQDRALQQITFNAFKKPVNITEPAAPSPSGRAGEGLDFQYNAALQRSTMYYGSDDTDKELRPMRRHYSEDGGMEITRNITTGETNFVFYLSGDAYSAPAIYKEVHSGNSQPATQNLFYLHRDHLGSIVLITDVDGNAAEKRQFDAWGNIVALTDGAGNALVAFVITDRGYTGHEHLLGIGLINMNGRLYDPKLHRFLSPDNFVQDPSNTQNFNRYGYVMNNPLIASDPSGEFIFSLLAVVTGQWWALPMTIGADLGMWQGGSIANGTMNPTKWDWSSGKTWGYMAGGAVVGGLAGGAANAISTSGGVFANTAAIAGGSFINSVGTFMYTGGQTDVSISFGFGSYNFGTGEFGYLGKKGNSFGENLGYGLGALANAADVLAGLKPGNVELRTENDPNYSKTVDANGNPIPQKDLIGHSQIMDAKGRPLVDFGPAPGNSVSGFGEWVPGTNSYEGGIPIPASKMKWEPIAIKGVNTSRISNWNPTGKYNLMFNSCVSQTSRALNMSGAFNVGIHPYILHAQMYMRSIGVRPMLYSHYLTL